MAAALALMFLLAAVSLFVFGFVLQEERRALRAGWSRVAGLPDRVRASDATEALRSAGHRVGRTSARAVAGAKPVMSGAWRALVDGSALTGRTVRGACQATVAFGRMARRAVSEARARREIVAEARRRRAARASFEQTFEATVPLELEPAQLRPAVF